MLANCYSGLYLLSVPEGADRFTFEKSNGIVILLVIHGLAVLGKLSFPVRCYCVDCSLERASCVVPPLHGYSRTEESMTLSSKPSIP